MPYSLELNKSGPFNLELVDNIIALYLIVVADLV